MTFGSAIIPEVTDPIIRAHILNPDVHISAPMAGRPTVWGILEFVILAGTMFGIPDRRIDAGTNFVSQAGVSGSCLLPGTISPNKRLPSRDELHDVRELLADCSPRPDPTRWTYRHPSLFEIEQVDGAALGNARGRPSPHLSSGAPSTKAATAAEVYTGIEFAEVPDVNRLPDGHRDAGTHGWPVQTDGLPTITLVGARAVHENHRPGILVPRHPGRLAPGGGVSGENVPPLSVPSRLLN